MASYSSHNHLIIFLWVLLLAPLMVGGETPTSPPTTIAPHCPDKCGNISIPYPFGLEDGCYYVERNNQLYNTTFKLNCNASEASPLPIFGDNIEILDISVPDVEMRMNGYISYDCYNNQGESLGGYLDWAHLSSFSISRTKNKIIGTGCDTIALFSGVRYDDNTQYDIGCLTTCNDLEDVPDGECNGIGCCEISLPDGTNNYSISIMSVRNHTDIPFNPCSAVYPIASDAFRFNKLNLTQDLDFYDNNILKVPVVFNWAIGTTNCSFAQNEDDFLCKDNTICEDPPKQMGYRCRCKQGFTGNPYLPQGCVDIDECKELNDCTKPAYCVNEIGSYHCKCPEGYSGNGTIAHPCISNMKPWIKPVVITAGIAGGIIIILMVAFILYWKNGRRELKKMREKYFRQNGGLLLHEKLSGKDVDVLKIFTAEDIEIATNNFSENYIIGKGGFGVVYKGILPNNQQVAVKRSLKVDPDQVEQFVNEVLILSQINNKNIVELLGCCLDTEVPLLVYEFINNGTLYDHLIDEVKASILTWDLRLKIALEVANVLSYLHNTISTQIIHRDMKSMNILLDKNYVAKVSDFGASRLIPENEGQLATMVLGTWGYLDPEYMQTSELTEKSDVYSFGVVLVELLTRKKVISNDRPEIEKCLSMHFLIQLKQGCLVNILDKNIVSEGTIDQIQQVANLAKWCLMLKGEDRPTMKEVAIELETIARKGSHDAHPWNIDVEPLLKGSESLLTGFSLLSKGDGENSSVMGSELYDPQMLEALEGGR